jgi:23S rRNA pseudouridine2605 synthase
LARALSKLGFCSRSQAWKLILAGRVKVNGGIQRDPERRVHPDRDRVEVEEQVIQEKEKVYLMLNKPRGLVTTASDERGRQTVFKCLPGSRFVSPVGRLDKASEGLLLFTNDTMWAARITDPATHLDKTYHVQINCLADEQLVSKLLNGVDSEGERLNAKTVSMVRQGEKNSWLEIVLDEGRNRHIRRLLQAFEIEVLRLIRIAIGPLRLGPLAKGEVRSLTGTEIRLFRDKSSGTLG